MRLSLSEEEKVIEAEKKKKEKEEENKVQTKVQPGQTPTTVTPALENRLNASRGGGQPLPESTCAFMESRFNRDFSQVRVHTDPQSAQALNAQAFTRGGDIFFGSSQYQPENPASQRLLAHELTHVVQQGAAPAKPASASK